jgi:ribosomal protein L22
VAEPKKTRANPRVAKDEAAQEAAEVKATLAAEQADEAAEASAEQADAVAQETPAPGKPRRTRKKADDAPAEKSKPTSKRAPGERPVVRAHAKYVRTSARKARLVCDHIRGKSVPEARAILAHTPRAVAHDWQKLLESAVANAEHNHELIGDELHIDSITADEGPTLKRFRPRAMGRASAIRKRTSHLSISLTPKE